MTEHDLIAGLMRYKSARPYSLKWGDAEIRAQARRWMRSFSRVIADAYNDAVTTLIGEDKPWSFPYILALIREESRELMAAPETNAGEEWRALTPEERARCVERRQIFAEGARAAATPRAFSAGRTDAMAATYEIMGLADSAIVEFRRRAAEARAEWSVTVQEGAEDTRAKSDETKSN